MGGGREMGVKYGRLPGKTGMLTGMVGTQEHCTSVRSDSGSEDFIPVSNSSKGIVGEHIEVCATLQDIPPQTITDPPQTDHDV